MPQVVTNENILDVINHRPIPAFEPPKTEAKAPETPAKTPDPVDNSGEQVQARDSSGKFVKTDAPKAEEEVKTPPAKGDDDADLPERVRRQIGKKHREKMEAEEFAVEEGRRALAAESRAAALEAELKALKGTKSEPAQAKREGAPKPEDFKTVAEYVDALTDWKLEQKQTARDQAEAQKRQQAESNRVQTEFQQRIQKVAAEIPDYLEVVGASTQEVPPHLAQYIAESDIGPLMGYHLCKHPDELARLVKLSPIRAVAEIGKLEAKLETKPEKTPAPPVVSRAPAPIAPLDGGSTPVVKDPAKMTFQELRAYRQSERSGGKRA